jgi:alcohol dehydrogenase class IV
MIYDPESKEGCTMTPFGLMRLPASVTFGAGQRNCLGTLAAQIGKRALICTDQRLAAGETLRSLSADLRRTGLEVHVFDRAQPDLPVESLLDCLNSCGGFAPQLVIGIGGGSCLDLAKATALLLTHGGSVDAYYGEFKVPGPVLPVVAIPTTAGTGSEVTPVAVVGDSARNTKVGISSPFLIPLAAICDPELTLSCPPALTAYSAGDALTHAIEAFTAGPRTVTAELAQQHVFVGKNVLSDHFALLAITSIWRSLRTAYHNGSDLQARADLMLGALAAGCAFGSAGTAAAHAIQYPVGNLTHTAHGAGVAALLPYVMEYNRPASIPSFAQIARAVGLADPGSSDEDLSRRLVDEVARLLDSVGIPRTLKDLGLPADKQDWTAESALAITRLVKNNPRPLDLAAMRQITQAAFSGDRSLLQRA